MPRYRPSTNAKKVSNRQMRRYAQEAVNAGHRAVLVLISVLAQKGGDITVTQQTLDECGRRLQDLDYSVVPVEGKPEFVVRLLARGTDHQLPITPEEAVNLLAADINEAECPGLNIISIGSVLMAAPMWTLESGLTTVRGIQAAVKPLGWHVALGGGVINTGESQKDLDLYFLPMSEPRPTILPLLRYLKAAWGDYSLFSLQDSNYLEEQAYRSRGKFTGLLHGRRIDVFII